MWLSRPVGLECRNSTGLLRGKQRLHCWGVHTKFHVHRDPEHQTYLWVLEGLLGKQELAVARYVGKDTGGRGPSEYSLCELSRRSPFWH